MAVIVTGTPASVSQTVFTPAPQRSSIKHPVLSVIQGTRLAAGNLGTTSSPKRVGPITKAG